ncbi:MAG: hypothetical protein H6861_06515 [Rhodospirillales bacterium]|nr:hypothetical protein [Rhodospirillales bacterium]
MTDENQKKSALPAYKVALQPNLLDRVTQIRIQKQHEENEHIAAAIGKAALNSRKGRALACFFYKTHVLDILKVLALHSDVEAQQAAIRSEYQFRQNVRKMIQELDYWKVPAEKTPAEELAYIYDLYRSSLLTREKFLEDALDIVTMQEDEEGRRILNAYMLDNTLYGEQHAIAEQYDISCESVLAGYVLRADNPETILTEIADMYKTQVLDKINELTPPQYIEPPKADITPFPGQG